MTHRSSSISVSHSILEAVQTYLGYANIIFEHNPVVADPRALYPTRVTGERSFRRIDIPNLKNPAFKKEVKPEAEQNLGNQWDIHAHMGDD